MRRRAAIAIAICVTLSACSTKDDKAIGEPVHTLSGPERDALRASLSQTLPGGGGAQFKFMPVLVQQVADSSSFQLPWSNFGSKPQVKPSNYCGLVATGSGGFRKFAAVLVPDSNGQFVRGAVQHVEGGAGGVSDAPGGTTELCRSWGYVDFGLAN